MHFLLSDDTWSKRYYIPKNDGFCISSTQGSVVSLIFKTENYGLKPIYAQNDTPHPDMFSNIFSKTRSVY